jgi:hypothetical protein
LKRCIELVRGSALAADETGGVKGKNQQENNQQAYSPFNKFFKTF